MRKNILISACLLGEKVRYDGKIVDYDLTLLEPYKDRLIPCCPEVDGGLGVPRVQSEIQPDGYIETKEGDDVTDAFIKGAFHAEALALKHDIKVAILKSKSPSCSNKMIYDGTFTSTLKEGKGITVQILEKSGIKVFDENEIEEALSYLESL